MDPTLLGIIVVCVLCSVLIGFRCGYRLLVRCDVHKTCYRSWHADDYYMAFAILPLIGRTVTLGDYAALEARHPLSEADKIVATKMLLPGRLCYALFLWCLKLCVLNFYSRMASRTPWFRRACNALWVFIVLTFIAVIFATLCECRPLSLFWYKVPDADIHCQKGLANLITMAVTDMLTDVFLIVLPMPALWRTTLSFWTKIQLSLVFSVGILVVAVTVVRLPTILDDGVTQAARSLWATIEIGTACLVANVSFFFGLVKDLTSDHARLHSSASRPRGLSVHTSSSMSKSRTYVELEQRNENSQTQLRDKA